MYLTASFMAKAAGLGSVKEMARLCGVSRDTLHVWFNEDLGFFNLLTVGCQYPAPADQLPFCTVACLSRVPLERLRRYQQEKPALYQVILSGCVEVTVRNRVTFL